MDLQVTRRDLRGALTIEVSDDGTVEQTTVHYPDSRRRYVRLAIAAWLGAAAIYRIAGEEALTIPFPETQLPHQRLCIFQGEDAAVGLERVELRGIPAGGEAGLRRTGQARGAVQ